MTDNFLHCSVINQRQGSMEFSDSEVSLFSGNCMPLFDYKRTQSYRRRWFLWHLKSVVTWTMWCRRHRSKAGWRCIRRCVAI